MAKGSSFEREICKRLSIWWSSGWSCEHPRDDIFWRTSNSGGRATVRGKKGLKTKNSYSDICAIDPIGQPLLDAFIIEIKRGYSHETISDLLDKRPGAAVQRYERWIDKAETDRVAAGTPSWWLITRRDKRDTLLFMPTALLERIDPFKLSLVLHLVAVDKHYSINVSGVRLEEFLQAVQPEQIQDLLAEGLHR